MRPPHLGFVEQFGVEELQLGAQGFVIPYRVRGGAIDYMHQRSSALTVTQELMTQTNPRMRALQQPWRL